MTSRIADPAADLREAVNDVMRGGGKQQVCCPAHDDTTPSLSISRGREGRVLLHCHAGCAAGDVLRAAGLTMADVFPPPDRNGRGASAEEAYSYVDGDGVLLFQVVRRRPKDFRQRRPDGQGGWHWSLGDVRRVPYRLPELIDGIAAERTIWIVEGEKDADRLTTLGLCATTNPGGAGKWRPEYSGALRGARVVILPDADDAGRAHAQAVARALHGVAAEVRVLALPDLPQRGDVSDWLDAGGDREELEGLAAACPVWTPGDGDDDDTPTEPLPRLISAWEAPDPTPVDWIVPGVIPRGFPGVWAGADGAGKDAVFAALAVALASGTAPWGAQEWTGTRPRTVVLVSAEDPAWLAVSRLRALAAGLGVDPAGTLSRIHVIGAEATPTLDPTWVEHLVEEICRVGADLVMVGPLRDMIAGSENDSEAVAPVLRHLRAVCARTGAAVALNHHTGKPREGATPRDLIRGSSAIHAWARWAVVLAEGKGEGMETILTPTKLTLAPRAPEWRVRWEVAMQDGLWARATILRVEDGEGGAAREPRALTREEEILAYVAQHPGTSANAILKGLGGGRNTRLRAVRTLREGGQLVERDGGLYRPERGE